MPKARAPRPEGPLPEARRGLAVGGTVGWDGGFTGRTIERIFASLDEPYPTIARSVACKASPCGPHFGDTFFLGRATGTGCAPVVKRDLSRIPAGQVGFDDLCDLQRYFDGLATKKLAPPILVSSSAIEKTATTRKSGRDRFVFETDFQLQTIRRVLNENWKRLPEGLADATRVELEVRWSEKAGLRRVASNGDAALIVAGRSSALPYHVCLSELLFGEALYRQRRELLGLTPLPSESATTGEPNRHPDADAGRSDAHLSASD